MSHSSINKPFFVNKGLLKKTGGAGKLAKGELAFVKDKSVKGGAEAISSFAGLRNTERIAIRLGVANTPAGLRDNHVPYAQTDFFPLNSIVSITANAPKKQDLKVDEFLVGYDGIDANTALTIPEGKSAVYDIALYGYPVEAEFGEECHILQMRAQREVGQSMQEVIRNLVAELKAYTVPRSRKTLDNFIDISVVDSSNTTLGGVESVFSTVTVTDDGTSNALAEVESFYSPRKVVRTDYKEGVSEYTILHLASDTLANYAVVTPIVYPKGCKDCLATYSLIEGGVVYHVNLEDNGVDSKATVQGLPGAVAGTAAKFGNDEGFGAYSVVLDKALTAAELASFITANPTAQVAVIGTTEDVCNKTTTVTVVPVSGESCFSQTKAFTLQLADNECGATRLAELQAAYPSLTIVEGAPTGKAEKTVTVSTDGVALAIIVNGVTYTTADAGTTSQTAAAFVAAHAAAILAATGATVTNPSANIVKFNDNVAGFPTITSAAQTVGAVTYVVAASTGGCQRVYSTSTITNLVCDACDTDFLQPFYADAPENYNGTYWKELPTVFDAAAKMGIKIKGKPYTIIPEQYAKDEIPFIQTSTKIRSTAFGMREMDYLNFAPAYDVDTEFANVLRLSYSADIKNLSQYLESAETMSTAFYQGETRHKNNLLARTNLGEESVMDYNQAWVSYHISYQDTSLSQAAGGRSNITKEVPIFVKVGYHTEIEDIINKLAAKVGLELVSPLAL
jgi:hypothetical protein